MNSEAIAKRRLLTEVLETIAALESVLRSAEALGSSENAQDMEAYHPDTFAEAVVYAKDSIGISEHYELRQVINDASAAEVMANNA